MDTVMIGLRVLVSLGVVLALLWWLHRRLSTGSRARGAAPVTVVAKQGIGSKASIVVIDVEGSRLVLGVTEQSVSVLQSADAPAADFSTSMDAALASSSKPASQAQPALGSRDRWRDPSSSTAPIELLARPRFTSAQFGAKGALAGSILSAGTWRQAATTLRRAR